MYLNTCVCSCVYRDVYIYLFNPPNQLRQHRNSANIFKVIKILANKIIENINWRKMGKNKRGREPSQTNLEKSETLKFLPPKL